MLETLQRRPIQAASAGVSVERHPRSARVRTATGRDWAPTVRQAPLVPTPRILSESSARGMRGTGRQRDWTPTSVMVPLPAGLIPAPRRAVDAELPEVGSATEADVPAHVVQRRLTRVLSLVLVNVVVLTSAVLFVGLAIGPRTGHYQTLTMLTGSMRPQFPTGSVVVVTREPIDAVRAGDVITFNAPTEDRRVVTHRIVRIDRSGEKPIVVTKGDANVGNDPWEAALNDPHVWQARFAIPFLGDGIRLLRQPQAQLIATRVVPGLMLLWLLVSIWRSDEKQAGEQDA